MEKRNELAAGLFVVIALFSTMAIILVLSGGLKVFTPNYTVYSKMKQVQGLGPNSIVSLAGIKIGSVVGLKMSDENSVIVEMKIEDTYQELIREDSVAELKTQGALGDKYVFITPGSPDKPAVQDEGFVMAAPGADLFELIASKGSEIGQIGDAIKELRTLLANLNENENSKKAMAGLAESTHSLKKLLTDARGENRELADSIKRINSILTKIDTGQGTLGALINDRALYERLTSLMGQSDKSKFLKPLIREAIKQQDK